MPKLETGGKNNKTITGRRQRPAIFANGQTLPRNPPAGWHDGAMTLWAKTTVLLSHVPGSCAFCPAKSFTKNPRYHPLPIRCRQQETGTVPRFPQSLAASRNPWRRAFAAVSAAARQPAVWPNRLHTSMDILSAAKLVPPRRVRRFRLMGASQQAADAVDFFEKQNQHYRNDNHDTGHRSDNRAVRILHV